MLLEKNLFGRLAYSPPLDDIKVVSEGRHGDGEGWWKNDIEVTWRQDGCARCRCRMQRTGRGREFAGESWTLGA
jgi:hypothetical protein